MIEHNCQQISNKECTRPSSNDSLSDKSLSHEVDEQQREPGQTIDSSNDSNPELETLNEVTNQSPNLPANEGARLECSLLDTSSGSCPKEPTTMYNNDPLDSSDPSDEQETATILSSQRSEASSAASITTSSSRRSSIQDRIKKSSSFITKLNNDTRGVQHSNPTNLPSTLASAFSSLTSFTSNFSLGTSSTLNDSQNSNIQNSYGRTSSANLSIETASTSTRASQFNETKDDVFLRKAMLERKNLISLTKLIVKDLISSSIISGRTIESDCASSVHLNNYFTLIDRVLKHGLKQNLFSTRSAGLWSALDNLPKYLKESTLMSESIRSLTHTKTPDGKIRAWLRLAMMQKRLPEYFNELLAQRGILLKDIYHDCAFMLNDEAHVFAGLIIGVNVIDCNFFVKDANFDAMDDIIDLSPYLRVATTFDEDESQTESITIHEQQIDHVKNMSQILDQKNYLEEWNKRLETTINNLHAKIKLLQERNSRLEMEAKVSEARMNKLQERRGESTFVAPKNEDSTSAKIGVSNSGSLVPIPDAIKNMINRSRPATNKTQTTSNISEASSYQHSKDLLDDVRSEPATVVDKSVDKNATNDVNNDDDLTECSSSGTSKDNKDHRQLTQLMIELDRYKCKNLDQEKELTTIRERVGILETSYRGSLDKIRTLERDLDIQTSMNSDKETTIKIYEKDIREKQQQVESLRESLADAKKHNSELSDRLSDTSAKLKDRLKSVSQLQSSLDKWKLENKNLASRLQESQTSVASLTNELKKCTEQIKDLKKYNEKINDDLRRERECGQSSSVTVEEQNIKIAELTDQVQKLEKQLDDLGPYRDQYGSLKKRCQDYEQSLEEIGDQLRESRLEVESLKENSSVFLDSQWMDSKQVKTCTLCQQSFSVTRRKHHCRLCGNVFCQNCSDNKMELASSAKPVRVCDTCHAFLLAKFVKTASSSSSMTT